MSREYPDRPLVGVGAAVIVSWADRTRLGVPAGRPAAGVVLVKRRFPPLAGEWSLPGGVVEVGETLKAAVIREVLEETGLVVTLGPVLEVFDRIVRDDSGRVQYHYVLVDYLCHAAAGRLAYGSDVSDAVVADPADLSAYALANEARSVIARALAMKPSG